MRQTAQKQDPDGGQEDQVPQVRQPYGRAVIVSELFALFCSCRPPCTGGVSVSARRIRTLNLVYRGGCLSIRATNPHPPPGVPGGCLSIRATNPLILYPPGVPARQIEIIGELFWTSSDVANSPEKSGPASVFRALWR